MKNKKNLYILLPAVILVWGLLIYKIIAATQPTNSKEQLVAATQFKHLQLKDSETFTINTNYRDPFLGTFSKKKTVKKIRSKKAVAKKPATPFPKIIYKGVVSQKGNRGQIFLISINGQQYFFKRNSTHNEVKLVRGTSEKVVLKFQGQQQTFQLSK